MAKWTLYHNPQCSKSREALALLKSKAVEFEAVEYLKTPLSKEELEVLIGELDSPVSSLVRQKESLFQENPFDVDNTKIVAEKLAATPRLMERPILRGHGKATIGRPAEKFLELISKR